LGTATELHTKLWVGNLKGRENLNRLRNQQEENIRMDLREKDLEV
jgi:hypothetical protein